VHHGPAQEAALDLATGADAGAHGQRLLHRRVKREEAQRAHIRAVVHPHQQLASLAQAHLAVDHRAFDLNVIALACIGQAGDAGLVFITQRQV
jgi:hypothetical protein